MRALAAFALALPLLVSGVARADQSTSSTSSSPGRDETPSSKPSLEGMRTEYVEFPMAPVNEPAADGISKIIYVNRCADGCTITKAGVNNALTGESRIPMGNDGQTFTVSPFQHGDAVWAQVMECVRDVYAPYDVEITDVDPGTVAHHEAIAAGTSDEIGWGANVLGVGGGAGCQPANNVISFTFANMFPASNPEEICSTIAQESAHAFGLADHLFDCTDPMTYLEGCGRKFFRDRLTRCGEFAERECQCDGTRQNSHRALIGVFGAGQDVAAPTSVEILYPTPGLALTGDTLTVQARGEDPRGIYHMRVLLNGWLWASWDAPDAITAPWPAESNVVTVEGFPDGVIDVEVQLCNDFDKCTSSTVQVTKGSPCTTADTCLEGQACTDGKCAWAAPTGQIGDACTYDEFCLGPNTFDGKCVGINGQDVCTRDCYSGANDDCGEGYYCAETNASTGAGLCVVDEQDGGGCCSTGADGGQAALAHLLLAGAVAGFVFGRRRRA